MVEDKSWNAKVDGVLVFPDWTTVEEVDRALNLYRTQKHYELHKIWKGSPYYFSMIPEVGAFRHELCSIDSITTIKSIEIWKRQ